MVMKTPIIPIDFSFAFQELPPVVLQKLADCASVIRLEPREVLFHQGDPAEYIYLVHSGVLRLIEHSINGQDVSLQVFGRGDVMGIFTIAGTNPLPGRVEALDESIVFAIHRDPFLNLLCQYPELSLCVIKMLISRITSAHNRIRELIVERAEQRLARALLRFAEKFGQQNGDVIEIHILRQDLAEFAGTTIETVSRILRQWHDAGYIRCKRKQLVIVNKAALAEIVTAV